MVEMAEHGRRLNNYQRRLGLGIRGILIQTLPRPLLRRFKRLLLLPLDGVDAVFGRRKELVPPRYLSFVGGGDFEAIGDDFLRHFIDLGGLSPEDRVLDVGCGIGRLARPLTKYLVAGSYEGIDIVPQGIKWCQQNITNRYPNFRFQLADIFNRMYNARGRFQPAEYRLPFSEREFDFCYLTSVFTHMLRRDMEHYLAEVARTLRPNGRSLITFFLLNEESRGLMSAGRSSLDFKFALDGCWTDEEDMPEHAVAFDEAYIRALYRELGFTLETVRYGAWCGRAEYLSSQDIVVARKS